MKSIYKINILIFFGLIIFAFPIISFGQNPVSWSLESDAKGKTLKSGEKFEAKLKAEIEGKWHLYAIEQPEGGPIPTTVKLPEDSKFIIDGKINSQEPITEFDPNFKINTKFYSKSAEFKVPFQAKSEAGSEDLLVKVRFQVCDDTLCLPPKTVNVTFAGFNDANKSAYNNLPPIGNNLNENNETSFVYDQNNQNDDVWGFIWLALSLGALSLLTPCVFPMIPITVSYFTKNSAGSRPKAFKLATIFSLGIIATFTLLGMLLAVLVGAAGINLFAANPWVNIAIAAIFLFFAFNLFGFYELTIPNGVLTKLDKLTRTKEGEGSGIIGALLMGLTFTVTSFTCTSPFVGTILVSTSQGDWQMPLLGMLAFSTVFALPFFVLALAPQLVSQLPKSGGWLNSVKVVMGFLEIAAALKFLSNVDLVWTSNFTKSADMMNFGTIFSREIVLAMWVIIAVAIGLYILGVFKFKFDSPVKKITPIRLILAFIFFALGIYLTTGILGKKLGELESFLPPKNAESRLNVLGNKETELKWIKNDFEGAIRKAKTENKKIFVDFTGYTCTNCRWMEANMFPQPEVREELEKFVLVSLYTDGEGEIYYRQQQFQEKTFKTVALPFYAIFDSNGKPTAAFPGLTRNKQEFVDFLKQSQ
jgi:thiol:disulfide interchange protein DsbD